MKPGPSQPDTGSAVYLVEGISLRAALDDIAPRVEEIAEVEGRPSATDAVQAFCRWVNRVGQRADIAAATDRARNEVVEG